MTPIDKWSLSFEWNALETHSNILDLYALAAHMRTIPFKSYKYQIGQLNQKVKREGYLKDIFDYSEKLCKKKTCNDERKRQNNFKKKKNVSCSSIT